MPEFTISIDGGKVPVLWDIGPVPPLSIECEKFNHNCVGYYDNTIFITKEINLKNISYIHIKSPYMDHIRWSQTTVIDIVYDVDYDDVSRLEASISFVFASEREYLKNKLRGL